MYIDRNLQALRKRDKITQEELADRLNVSRQSVSKWETGEAYPETDKLIMLCDLFGVSLDDLLRRDLSGNLTAETTPAETKKTASEKASQIGYGAHMNSFTRFVTFGVFLILFGVAVCVMLSGFAATLADTLKSFTEIMAAVAVLVFVAAAVFLFVFGGISHDRFMSRHQNIVFDFDPSETASFSRRFTVAIACLVSGIILDVVFLVVMLALVETGIVAVANTDAAGCFIVSAFLFVLALIVGGLVYFGMQHSKYSAATDEGGAWQTKKPTKSSKIADGVCGVIMMTATAVFLLLGFLGNLWHPGWVIFPIGGILCGIIGTIAHTAGKGE